MERSIKFISQIRRDANFLATLEIMDYSLLLGIHRRTEQQGDTRSRSSFLLWDRYGSGSGSENELSGSENELFDETHASSAHQKHAEDISIFYADEGGYQSRNEQGKNPINIYLQFSLI